MKKSKSTWQTLVSFKTLVRETLVRWIASRLRDTLTFVWQSKYVTSTEKYPNCPALFRKWIVIWKTRGFVLTREIFIRNVPALINRCTLLDTSVYFVAHYTWNKRRASICTAYWTENDAKNRLRRLLICHWLLWCNDWYSEWRFYFAFVVYCSFWRTKVNSVFVWSWWIQQSRNSMKLCIHWEILFLVVLIGFLVVWSTM
jgi:hypothetical protein